MIDAADELGLSIRIINLIKELNTLNTTRCFQNDGQFSDLYDVKSVVPKACAIATEFIPMPMDWTNTYHACMHKGLEGAMLADEFFIDFHYADNVALLAEMLDVLQLALLEVMNTCGGK
jgi:hypothetical protein